MYTEDGDGFLAPLMAVANDGSYDLPRQQLPKVFSHSGHLDVVRAATVIERDTISGHRIRPLFVEDRFSADIDTPEDLSIVRFRFSGVRGDIDVPAAPNPAG
jgi:CMP-N-acetylneuraminic acid synthetase